MKESEVQKKVINWCQYFLRPDVVYWSTPNERKSKPQHMEALKLMGLLPGVADLSFIWDDGGLKMLFVEIKRPPTYKRGKRGGWVIDKRGGAQSLTQHAFQCRVENIGCLYYLVDRLGDFIGLMEKQGLAK